MSAGHYRIRRIDRLAAAREGYNREYFGTDGWVLEWITPRGETEHVQHLIRGDHAWTYVWDDRERRTVRAACTPREDATTYLAWCGAKIEENDWTKSRKGELVAKIPRVKIERER